MPLTVAHRLSPLICRKCLIFPGQPMKAKRTKTKKAASKEPAHRPGSKGREASPSGGAGRKTVVPVPRQIHESRPSLPARRKKTPPQHKTGRLRSQAIPADAYLRRLKIPRLLLEKETPPLPPPVSAPTHRHVPAVPAPPPPMAHLAAPIALPVIRENPDQQAPLLPVEGSNQGDNSGVTVQLHLVAVDARWLHAQWDLAGEAQKRCNALSLHGHLILRIFRASLAGNPTHEPNALLPLPHRGRGPGRGGTSFHDPNSHQDFELFPFQEINLTPDARDWFVQLGEPGTEFVAELGYYTRTQEWMPLAVSQPVSTPTDTISEDSSGQFETVLVDEPLSSPPAEGETWTDEAQSTSDAISPSPDRPVNESRPSQPAPPTLKAGSHASGVAGAAFPTEPEAGASPGSLAAWTLADEAALYELIWRDGDQPQHGGSLDSAALARPSLLEGPAAAVAPELGSPLAKDQAPPGISSLSAIPTDGGPPRSFWFNLNVELVIYGATEPDAVVTLGGRQIKLRPDGSFSCRFALPDGIFSLAAEAASADGQDQRRAELGFSRATRYQAEVQKHPQDPSLKPPPEQNL